ncbi:MAG: hypothetical protein ACPL7D_07365, partial [Candidatus Sumerlaeaceae bacterium]
LLAAVLIFSGWSAGLLKDSFVARDLAAELVFFAVVFGSASVAFAFFAVEAFAEPAVAALLAACDAVALLLARAVVAVFFVPAALVSFSFSSAAVFFLAGIVPSSPSPRIVVGPDVYASFVARR